MGNIRHSRVWQGCSGVLLLVFLAGCSAVVKHRNYEPFAQGFEPVYNLMTTYHAQYQHTDPPFNIYLQTRQYDQRIVTMGPLIPIIPWVFGQGAPGDTLASGFVVCDLELTTADSLDISWQDLSVFFENGDDVPVSIMETDEEYNPFFKPSLGFRSSVAFRCDFPVAQGPHPRIYIQLPAWTMGNTEMDFPPIGMEVVEGTRLMWGSP